MHPVVRHKLTYIQNGDFDNGLEGWEVRLGAEGTMAVKEINNYGGKLQKRYRAPKEVGGHVLWMKRSMADSNVVSQPVCGREMAAAWKITENYARGKFAVKDFFGQTVNDHTIDIIESMWGGLNKQFYINSANRGAVTNLAPDAFLELRCDLDMRGPRPQSFGEMPRGLLALTQTVLDTHELTALAAVTGDRAILRRAMLTDPICNNIGDADACLRDFFKAERDVLPAYWFKGAARGGTVRGRRGA